MTIEATAPTLSDIYPEQSGFSANDFKKKNQMNISVPKSKSKCALLLILGIGTILLVGFGLGYLCRQPNVHHHQIVADKELHNVKNSSLDLATDQQHQPVSMDQNLTVSYQNDNQTLLESSELRLEFIRKMTLAAWEAHFGTANVPPTYTDGGQLLSTMSTLWILGFKEQFNRAERWIWDNLILSRIDTELRVSSLVSNYIGGLLSCYALTGETAFLQKALDIVHEIEAACVTHSGRAYDFYTILLSCKVSTTSIAKQIHEYACLENMARMDANIDCSPWIKLWIYRMKSYLQEAETPLLSRPRHRKGGYTKMTQLLLSLAKLYIQLGSSSSRSQYNMTDRWYRDALNSLGQKANKVNRSHTNSCYLGAILYLRWNVSTSQTQRHSQNELHSKQIDKHLKLALELIKSCDHYSVRRLVEPELQLAMAESYFILWRLTHDQKYRDFAWEMAQVIHQYYYEMSHFLSKFLYLTFTEDFVMPLDQWVFNSAGHPLPISGTNGACPNCGFTFAKLFKQAYNYLVKLVS